MSDDLHTLAAAVVQSPHWRWMPGMLAAAGSAARVALRVLVLAEDGVPVEWAAVPDGRELHIVVTGYGTPGWCADVWLRDALPDLRDPATLGCLLALVREAHKDPTIHAVPVTVDSYHGEPVVRWCIERHHEGEDEWMRESGAFGEMPDGHRDPPIVAASEPAALVAALLAAGPR